MTELLKNGLSLSLYPLARLQPRASPISIWPDSPWGWLLPKVLGPAGVEGQPQTAERLLGASHCLRLPAHHAACRHKPWPDSPSWLEEDVCTWHPQAAEGSPGQAATGDTLPSSVPIRPRVADQSLPPPPPNSLAQASLVRGDRAPKPCACPVVAQPGPSNKQTSHLGQVRRAGPGRRQQTGLRGLGPICPRRCVGCPPTPPLSSPGVGVGILTCMGREHMLVSTSFRASEYLSLPKSLVRLF